MNFKRIAALTVAFSCVTSLVPSTLSMGTSVYAATTENYLSDISLETNKGKEVTIYTKSSCSSKYKLSKLDSDDKVPTTLYAKVSSSVSKVNFKDIDLNDSDVTYEIRKGSTKIDLDEDVKLSSSSTSFKINILDNNNKTLKTYTLKITKESNNEDEDDEEDENHDDIYLEKMELYTFDNKEIDFKFKKTTSSYDINVGNSVTSIKVFAEPEYDEYTVRVNGLKVDEDDDWTRKVALAEGKNEIPVKIKDEDGNERIYTLNVTRAVKSSSSNNINSSNTATNITDNTTNVEKPSPNNTAPKFPTTKLGWVTQGNNWYFVKPDGTCTTGWVYSSNKWYYMDTNGIMKTGWVQVPSNNKWYYFYSNGEMASNTIIGGYRLGSDGAWIQ